MKFKPLEIITDIDKLSAEIRNYGSNVTISRSIETASEISPSSRVKFRSLHKAWLYGLSDDLPIENALYCINRLLEELSAEDRDTLITVMFPESRK